MSSAALWHEVECGGYSADLSVWERLVESVDGLVLELGCGTGRVALHLARRGREVWAVDSKPALVEELQARASQEELAVRAVCADVRALALGVEFETIIAPMQLVQMLEGRAERQATLERAAGHLTDTGRVAAAIVERPAASFDDPVAVLPDVRERGDWVYSSLPTVVPMADGCLEIRRQRQAVSPDGSLSQEEHVDRLQGLDADGLETEAAGVGLRPEGRIDVPPSEGYLGATVVVLGRA